MAVGMTRSEQGALIATILLIVGGLAWQSLGSGDGEGVWIESEPGWRPVALASPAPQSAAPQPAAPQSAPPLSLGSPAASSTNAPPTRLEAALASADAAPIIAKSDPTSAAPPASPATAGLATPASATPTAPVPSGAVAAIDLNRATAAELDRLPGIGPAKAAAIVEHRDRLGAFGSLDDFLQVKGIGPSDIEKIRPYIVPLPERAAAPALAAAPVQPAPSAPPRAPARVNINTATSEQLQTLPGIGPVLADRIIAARRARPFRRPEDLLAVRGIGEKTFANLRALVSAP